MTQNKNMNVEEFQPMQNFILVHPVELERGEVQTETGLVLATEQNTSVVDRSTTGKVISIGSKCEEIEPGMEVLWPRTDGIDISFKNGDMVLLKETSIIGYRKC